MTIVSLVSDLPKVCCDFSIRINNTKAGQGAARLMGLTHVGCKESIVLLAGSMDAQDQTDRLHGFQSVLQQDFKRLDITAVFETNDHSIKTRRRPGEYLNSRNNVIGVYNVGTGNDGFALPLLRYLNWYPRNMSVTTWRTHPLSTEPR